MLFLLTIASMPSMAFHAGPIARVGGASSRLASMPSMATAAKLPGLNILETVKNSVVPDNTDNSINNLLAVQALSLGAVGLYNPTWVLANLWGAGGKGTAITAGALAITRCLSLASLCLGGRFATDTKEAAAASGGSFSSVSDGSGFRTKKNAGITSIHASAPIEK